MPWPLLAKNGVGKKIKKVIEKIRQPFNKIIDWCIDKVLQGIDWLKSKLGGGKDEDAAKKAVQEVDEKWNPRMANDFKDSVAQLSPHLA